MSRNTSTSTTGRSITARGNSSSNTQVADGIGGVLHEADSASRSSGTSSNSSKEEEE